MLMPSNVWARRLPLDVIMIVTSELYPKIQSLQTSLSGPTVNTAIADLLRSATLQEHLPKPGPLTPRWFAVSTYQNIQPFCVSNMSYFVVDGCFHSLANVAHMGRDLHPRHDPPGHMELDECSPFLCETHASPAATDYGNSIKRRWWSPRKDGVFAVYATETVNELVSYTWISRCCTNSRFLGNGTLNSLTVEAPGTAAHQLQRSMRLGAEGTRTICKCLQFRSCLLFRTQLYACS